MQWGAFSPILRTHDRGASAGGCANKHWPTLSGDCAQLRPWNVPPIFFVANRIAMRMRAELLPYIYTAYRTLFDTGVALIRPLYYDSPHAPAAYARPMEATADVVTGEVSEAAKLANSANQIANQVNRRRRRRRRRRLRGGEFRRLDDEYDDEGNEEEEEEGEEDMGFTEENTDLFLKHLEDHILTKQLDAAAAAAVASSQSAEARLSTEIKEVLDEIELQVEGQLKSQQSLPEQYRGSGLDEAQSTFEFMFGPDLLVAPVVKPADQWNETLGHVDIWFPPGTWIERHSGAVFEGAAMTGTLRKELRYHLNEIPVFARAHAIIATIPIFDGSHASAARGDSGGSTVGTAQRDFDHLIFTVHLDGKEHATETSRSFEGTTHVYQDDGRSTAYMHDSSQHGHKDSAVATASYSWKSSTTLAFSMSTKGTYATLPTHQTVTLRIRNAVPSDRVSLMILNTVTNRHIEAEVPLCVKRNGHGSGILGFTGVAHYPTGCVRYDGTEGSLLVTVPNIPTLASATLQLSVDFGGYADALKFVPGLRGAIEHARLAKSTLDEARANPAGQCCEAPNEQPLKKLATLGVLLESLGGIRRMKETASTSKMRRHLHSRHFVAVMEDFPGIVTAATDEMRVLSGSGGAATRVLRSYLDDRQIRHSDRQGDIRNKMIIFIAKNHGSWSVSRLQKLSNIELVRNFLQTCSSSCYTPPPPSLLSLSLSHTHTRSFASTHTQAMNFGSAEALAGEKFYVVDGDKERSTAQERLFHALALMETAEDRVGKAF